MASKDLIREFDDLRTVTAAAVRVASGSQFADSVSLVALAQGVLAVPIIEGNAAQLFDDALALTADRVRATALVAELACLAASSLERWAEATNGNPERLLQEVARWHALRQVDVTPNPEDGA